MVWCNNLTWSCSEVSHPSVWIDFCPFPALYINNHHISHSSTGKLSSINTWSSGTSNFIVYRICFHEILEHSKVAGSWVSVRAWDVLTCLLKQLWNLGWDWISWQVKSLILYFAFSNWICNSTDIFGLSNQGHWGLMVNTIRASYPEFFLLVRISGKITLCV